MTKIVQDTQAECSLVTTLKSWLINYERLEDIHVSDVMYPRLAILKRRHGILLSDREVFFYTCGRAHHDVVEALVNKNEVKHDVELEYEGIVGSIDVLSSTDEPVEIKTTRVWYPYTEDNIPPGYTRQLGCYVAIANPGKTSGTGKLMIFYICPKDKKNKKEHPFIAVYNVEYDNLDIIRKEMVDTKGRILASMDNGNVLDFEECEGCKEYKKDNCAYKKWCYGES